MITYTNAVRVFASAKTLNSALKKKATPDAAVDVNIKVKTYMKKYLTPSRNPMYMHIHTC